MHISPPLILASCLVYENRHSADVANALHVLEFWLWRYRRCHTRDTNHLASCSCYTLCMHISPPLIPASSLVHKNWHPAHGAKALYVIEIRTLHFRRSHSSCYTLCMHVSPLLIPVSCLVIMNRQPAHRANAQLWHRIVPLFSPADVLVCFFFLPGPCLDTC